MTSTNFPVTLSHLSEVHLPTNRGGGLWVEQENRIVKLHLAALQNLGHKRGGDDTRTADKLPARLNCFYNILRL